MGAALAELDEKIPERFRKALARKNILDKRKQLQLKKKTVKRVKKITKVKKQVKEKEKKREKEKISKKEATLRRVVEAQEKTLDILKDETGAVYFDFSAIESMIKKFRGIREKQGKPSVNAQSTNMAVQRAMEESNGITRKPGNPLIRAINLLRVGALKTKHAFTRKFPKLNPKTNGEVINILRLVDAIPGSSRSIAATHLYEILNGMTQEQETVFTMNLVLPDLIADIEIDKRYAETGPFPENLPYKDLADIKKDLEHYKEEAATDELITNALEVRKNLLTNLQKQLVEEKILPKSILSRPGYFHRQILEHVLFQP